MSHMMYRILQILWLIMFLASCSSTDVDYNELDNLISQRESLFAEYEKQIDFLRLELKKKGIAKEQQYGICGRLCEEYAAYQYDSAYHYAKYCIELASQLKDVHKEVVSRLNMVHVLSVAGLFDKAEQMLDTLSVEDMCHDDYVLFLNIKCDLYQYKAEYAEGTSFYGEYQDSVEVYRHKLLDVAERTSETYTYTLANDLCQQGKYGEAIQTVERFLSQTQCGERGYSILTNRLASFYANMGDTVQMHKYLILSSMSDISGCIRENTSLSMLSSLLFSQGDIARAYYYLRTAIEDADHYNTRLRNSRLSKLVPQVVAAYQKEQFERRRFLVVTVIILAILALLLSTAIWIVSVFYRRYRKAHALVGHKNEQLRDLVERLKSVNQAMKESNKIKEEYICRFLSLCSGLIEEHDAYRKSANRLAREHKVAELYQLLKSDKLIADETRSFFQNFDAAFLNIYPAFITQVNRLLRTGEEISPQVGEKLCTELRILALMRLGICDNHEIATILRSSISTIYTYRSRMKSKAIRKDDFERLVREIDAF